MKVSKIFSGLLLGLTLLATGASAANKGSLTVFEPVSVNGTQLAKGDYQVKWEGTGPNVALNIIQSKRIVVTVPARLIDLNHPGNYTGYETQKGVDGMKSLTAIRFFGKNYELAIGEGPATTEMKDGSQE